MHFYLGITVQSERGDYKGLNIQNLELSNKDKNRRDKKQSKSSGEQALWWITHLGISTNHNSIPDVREMGCVKPVLVYSDAAGGSNWSVGGGIGGICPPHVWFYAPWPQLINSNRESSLGVRFAHKLTTLEGFRALVGLAVIPNLARNGEIHILVDNSGFVAIYGKKSSKCLYDYTIAKAIADIARGLSCTVRVLKTRRMSGTGEVIADALSKAEWSRAWPLMPLMNTAPEFIPRTLLRWIMDPKPDLYLGKRVLKEMSAYTKVLLDD